MTSVIGRAVRYRFLRNDGNNNLLENQHNGGVLIPVANGIYMTEEMSMSYSIGNVFFIFLDASLNPVTPTAGTITTEASAYDGQWLMPSGTGSHVIQADTVIAASDGVATYTPPSFDSRAIRTRITLTGVTGANFMIADHWRSVA